MLLPWTAVLILITSIMLYTTATHYTSNQLELVLVRTISVWFAQAPCMYHVSASVIHMHVRCGINVCHSYRMKSHVIIYALLGVGITYTYMLGISWPRSQSCATRYSLYFTYTSKVGGLTCLSTCPSSAPPAMAFISSFCLTLPNHHEGLIHASMQFFLYIQATASLITGLRARTPWYRSIRMRVTMHSCHGVNAIHHTVGR